MTRDEAWNLANHWIAAWNAHDLDLIMTHYEDAIELTSPVAAQLLGASGGRVAGKQNLRAYFQRGLQAYPDLHFRLHGCVLHRRRARGLRLWFGRTSDGFALGFSGFGRRPEFRKGLLVHFTSRFPSAS